MKFSHVEVAGFRGFKDVTRFDFPAGFVVLAGRNGAGKSTILDAVDYAFTGTINKFAVKGAKAAVSTATSGGSATAPPRLNTSRSD